jgi:alpha-L-rhamnosidase
MLGHAEAWLFRGLGGVENAPAAGLPGTPGADAGSVAFKHFIVRPEVVEKLGAKDGRQYVRVTYDSARGMIESAWELKGKELTMNVTVPATTTATIYVPAREDAAVRAPGGAKVLTEKATGPQVYEVGAGRYTFGSVLP